MLIHPHARFRSPGWTGRGAGRILALTLGLGLGTGLSPLPVSAATDAPDHPAGAKEAPPVAVTAEPGVAILSPGRTAVFTATVSGTGNPAVTWAVDGIPNGSASLGTLTPGPGNTAVYTAPATPGRHTLTAVSAADPTRSATSIIQVVASGSDPAPAPTIPMSVAPATARLQAGAALTLTATVAGLANPALTWMVDGVANGSAAVGTITEASGQKATYTAPAKAGTHAVNAISVADPGQSAVSLITVLVNPPDSGSPGKPDSESLP